MTDSIQELSRLLAEASSFLAEEEVARKRFKGATVGSSYLAAVALVQQFIDGSSALLDRLEKAEERYNLFAVRVKRIEELAFYLNPSQEQDAENMTEIRRLLRSPSSGFAAYKETAHE